MVGMRDYNADALQLRGVPISSTPPSDQQVYVYDADTGTFVPMDYVAKDTINDAFYLTPGNAVIPVTSPATIRMYEVLPGGANIVTGDFSNSAVQYLTWLMAFPAGWTDGKVLPTIRWTTPSNLAGSVTWNLRGYRFNNGNPLGWGLASLYSGTGNVQGTFYNHEMVAGDYVTVPGVGQLVAFQVYRTPGGLAGIASILSVELKFKRGSVY